MLRDFWSGQSSGFPLLNPDFSPTPLAGIYERLVLTEWRTETEGLTDKNGNIEADAFLGASQKHGKQNCADFHQAIMADAPPHCVAMPQSCLRLRYRETKRKSRVFFQGARPRRIMLIARANGSAPSRSTTKSISR